MKNTIKLLAALTVITLSLASCEQVIEPQGATVTSRQAANAPGAFDNFVGTITNELCGKHGFMTAEDRPWDYGYPTFYLMRDVMGQDIVCNASSHEWYGSWYTANTSMNSGYELCQVPWRYFYKWINSCNTVIGLAGAEPSENNKVGTGIAYAMRALFYEDIAQMYVPQSNGKYDPQALTVPIVTESTPDVAKNPRATNKEMYEFILSDLKKAEEFLAGYKRTDVYTPDVSVVYGLMARAYLITEQWALAKDYAEKAMIGYTMMTAEQYLSRKDGFNTPNAAWIMGMTFKSTDPCILNNDGDSSWGSQMIHEVVASGCGYAANYGALKQIDAHLFSTIPASDFRHKCFVDTAIDALPTKEEQIAALAAYTDDPEGLYKNVFVNNADAGISLGCTPLKFRPKNGEHADQYKAWTVAVPMMRVEEMKLIQAEAAGRINENEGIALLTAFAKTRDPQYVYGKQKDAYYNTSTGTFLNEIWWQRRVELWGEGFSTYDIKRFGKGIIRNYPGTNHADGYRWNVKTTPQWMVFCITDNEIAFNKSIKENNPSITAPTGNSEVFEDWESASEGI